jgi:hypothetical protein
LDLLGLGIGVQGEGGVGDLVRLGHVAHGIAGHL